MLLLTVDVHGGVFDAFCIQSIKSVVHLPNGA